MPIKQFPYNPTINYVEYDGAKQELTIDFKLKKTGRRTYGNVPKEAFYGLYYISDLKQMLSYYSKHLKKKFEIVNIFYPNP